MSDAEAMVDARMAVDTDEVETTETVTLIDGLAISVSAEYRDMSIKEARRKRLGFCSGETEALR